MEHGLSGEAASVLLNKMERAIGGKARHNDVKGHLVEQPQSEERVDRRKNERLNAIVSLQQARARLMEESTASFEQVQKARCMSLTPHNARGLTAAVHVLVHVLIQVTPSCNSETLLLLDSKAVVCRLD